MNRVSLLFKRLGQLVLVYSISRALFLAFNVQSFSQVPAQEILSAFLVGVRFDVAAICRINALFMILSLLPIPFAQSTWYQKCLRVVFLVSNIPFLIINVVDYEYFKFIDQRSSLSLLDLGADISAQLGQLSIHYWYLVATGGLLIFAFCYFLPGRAPLPPATHGVQKSQGLARDLLVLMVVAGLGILGGRGGWQQMPLSVAQADVFHKPVLGQLTLNSSFTLLHSQRKCDARNFPRLHFYATDEELKREFPAAKPASRPNPERRDNIVIIIVESLSADYTGVGRPGHGYTPFLDGLAKNGVYFDNSFANGRRSIDASPSILAGLPHLRDETFFCTRMKQLHGIGTLLKERGYDTSFFHGGINGTMQFDVFSRRMGFDRYYGLNEYPKPGDSDGIWGIYDEPMLQFMAQEMSRRKEPFATVLFTLSTHNPYKIPPQYEGLFAKGELPIHETVGYFDHALKKFFATAERMPWYKNTLFVITGDHIGPAKAVSPRLIDNYRIPLVFFHPGHPLPKVSPDRITQHVDIGPSLLDYLGIETDKVLPFGHSIFDASYGGLAYGELSENYWIADKDHYMEFRFKGPSHLFSMGQLGSPATDRPEIKEKLEKKLKAYVQWFNNGLRENKLYQERE
jgi:phosphoglycerol transferase MdoB-like AlkP superfamily enzyme